MCPTARHVHKLLHVLYKNVLCNMTLQNVKISSSFCSLTLIYLVYILPFCCIRFFLLNSVFIFQFLTIPFLRTTCRHLFVLFLFIGCPACSSCYHKEERLRERKVNGAWQKNQAAYCRMKWRIFGRAREQAWVYQSTRPCLPFVTQLMTDGCVHLLYNISQKFHQLTAGQLLSGKPVRYGKGRQYSPSITYKITHAGSRSFCEPGGPPCWPSPSAFGLIG